MIISEKQIMQLIAFTHSYVSLIDLLVSNGISMNYPKEIKEEATNLINKIINQQSDETKSTNTKFGYHDNQT